MLKLRFALGAQAMARSVSSQGASEHDFALAFTNIGLHGPAINGPAFNKKHAKKLRGFFGSLLAGNTECIGLMLCEVGNIDHLCNHGGKQKINEVIHQAFTDAGATEHEKMKANQPYNKKMVLQSTRPPQIYWYKTCVAAFLPEVDVHELDPIENMPRVDSWRYAQRFLLRIGDD